MSSNNIVEAVLITVCIALLQTPYYGPSSTFSNFLHHHKNNRPTKMIYGTNNKDTNMLVEDDFKANPNKTLFLVNFIPIF